MERLRRPTRISIRERPFVLEYPEQFRPSPPPPLRSRPYARIPEVKEHGAADSAGGRTIRPPMPSGGWSSPRDSSIAWRGNLPPIVTCISGELPVCSLMWPWRSSTHTWRHGTRSVYDHWRPHTRLFATSDQNPITTADLSWEPLRPTPPFRIHVGSRGCLRRLFGVLAGHDRLSFTMETTTAPPGMPRRTFASFREAAAECADSRVRLGGISVLNGRGTRAGVANRAPHADPPPRIRCPSLVRN